MSFKKARLILTGMLLTIIIPSTQPTTQVNSATPHPKKRSISKELTDETPFFSDLTNKNPNYKSIVKGLYLGLGKLDLTTMEVSYDIYSLSY